MSNEMSTNCSTGLEEDVTYSESARSSSCGSRCDTQLIDTTSVSLGDLGFLSDKSSFNSSVAHFKEELPIPVLKKPYVYKRHLRLNLDTSAETSNTEDVLFSPAEASHHVSIKNFKERKIIRRSIKLNSFLESSDESNANEASNPEEELELPVKILGKTCNPPPKFREAEVSHHVSIKNFKERKIIRRPIKLDSFLESSDESNADDGSENEGQIVDTEKGLSTTCNPDTPKMDSDADKKLNEVEELEVVRVDCNVSVDNNLNSNASIQVENVEGETATDGAGCVATKNQDGEVLCGSAGPKRNSCYRSSLHPIEYTPESESSRKSLTFMTQHDVAESTFRFELSPSGLRSSVGAVDLSASSVISNNDESLSLSKRTDPVPSDHREVDQDPKKNGVEKNTDGASSCPVNQTNLPESATSARNLLDCSGDKLLPRKHSQSVTAADLTTTPALETKKTDPLSKSPVLALNACEDKDFSRSGIFNTTYSITSTRGDVCNETFVIDNNAGKVDLSNVGIIAVQEKNGATNALNTDSVKSNEDAVMEVGESTNHNETQKAVNENPNDLIKTIIDSPSHEVNRVDEKNERSFGHVNSSIINVQSASITASGGEHVDIEPEENAKENSDRHSELELTLHLSNDDIKDAQRGDLEGKNVQYNEIKKIGEIGIKLVEVNRDGSSKITGTEQSEENRNDYLEAPIQEKASEKSTSERIEVCAHDLIAQKVNRSEKGEGENNKPSPDEYIKIGKNDTVVTGLQEENEDMEIDIVETETNNKTRCEKPDVVPDIDMNFIPSESTSRQEECSSDKVTKEKDSEKENVEHNEIENVDEVGSQLVEVNENKKIEETKTEQCATEDRNDHVEVPIQEKVSEKSTSERIELCSDDDLIAQKVNRSEKGVAAIDKPNSDEYIEIEKNDTVFTGLQEENEDMEIDIVETETNNKTRCEKPDEVPNIDTNVIPPEPASSRDGGSMGKVTKETDSETENVLHNQIEKFYEVGSQLVEVNRDGKIEETRTEHNFEAPITNAAEGKASEKITVDTLVAQTETRCEEGRAENNKTNSNEYSGIVKNKVISPDSILSPVKSSSGRVNHERDSEKENVQYSQTEKIGEISIQLVEENRDERIEKTRTEHCLYNGNNTGKKFRNTSVCTVGVSDKVDTHTDKLDKVIVKVEKQVKVDMEITELKSKEDYNTKEGSVKQNILQSNIKMNNGNLEKCVKEMALEGERSLLCSRVDNIEAPITNASEKLSEKSTSESCCDNLIKQTINQRPKGVKKIIESKSHERSVMRKNEGISLAENAKGTDVAVTETNSEAQSNDNVPDLAIDVSFVPPDSSVGRPKRSLGGNESKRKRAKLVPQSPDSSKGSANLSENSRTKKTRTRTSKSFKETNSSEGSDKNYSSRAQFKDIINVIPNRATKKNRKSVTFRQDVERIKSPVGKVVDCSQAKNVTVCGDPELKKRKISPEGSELHTETATNTNLENIFNMSMEISKIPVNQMNINESDKKTGTRVKHSTPFVKRTRSKDRSSSPVKEGPVLTDKSMQTSRKSTDKSDTGNIIGDSKKSRVTRSKSKESTQRSEPTSKEDSDGEWKLSRVSVNKKMMSRMQRRISARTEDFINSIEELTSNVSSRGKTLAGTKSGILADVETSSQTSTKTEEPSVPRKIIKPNKNSTEVSTKSKNDRSFSNSAISFSTSTILPESTQYSKTKSGRGEVEDLSNSGFSSDQASLGFSKRLSALSSLLEQKSGARSSAPQRHSGCFTLAETSSCFSEPCNLDDYCLAEGNPKTFFRSANGEVHTEPVFVKPATPKDRKKRRPTKSAPLVINGVPYKKRKKYKPAAWVTNNLYKFLEQKLKPVYGIETRLMSEKIIGFIHAHVTSVIKNDLYNEQSIQLVKEMLFKEKICTNTLTYFMFLSQYMPGPYYNKALPCVSHLNE